MTVRGSDMFELLLLLSGVGTPTAAPSLFEESPLFDESPAHESREAGGESLFDSAGSELGEAGASAHEPLLRSVIRLELSLGLDTAFDREQEQLFELSIGASLELEAQPTPELGVFVLPKIRYLFGVVRSFDDRATLLLDFPEAHLSWSLGPLVLRLGTLVAAWGSSDLIAPSDILNPVDLRRGTFDSKRDNKIPVFAAEVVFTEAPLIVRGWVQPFFTPARYFVTGWDTALDRAIAAPSLHAFLGPETLDRTLDQLLLTELPSSTPENATVGLRLTGSFDRADVSTTFYHGFEPFPKLSVNPAFGGLVGILGQRARDRSPIDFSDPTLAPVLAELNRALAAGEHLFRGEIVRRTLFGIDGTLQLDPFIFKLDTAFTPRRLVYFRNQRAETERWLDSVVGAEWTQGDFFVTVEGFMISVFDVSQPAPLLFLERANRAASSGRDVFVPGATGVARYSAWNQDLELELFVLSTFDPGDLVIAPKVSLRLGDHQVIRLGALVLAGSSDSYSGTYSENDQVFATYEWLP
ncbi:MAG: hypothetical protein HY791_17020 [Deltaproteobacteria bacterium]|nr:hypothetical protein [Deltaproteobacteria bacterium]